VVVVNLDVVGGFNFGIEGMVARKVKPELYFVFNVVLAVLVGKSLLNIDCGAEAFSCKLLDQHFGMAKIVTHDGVGLSRKVSPGLDFDRFWLESCDDWNRRNGGSLSRHDCTKFITKI